MHMNQVQQQAVLHQEGPMLVLAGPGSGKTMVITERTKHLIRGHKVREDNILVITFTKAAANEMKERFLKSMGTDHTKVSFGTFHAVFFMILKYAYNLSSSNVIGEEDRFQCIKEIIHRLDLEYEDEKEFISELLGEISMVKGNRMDLSNYYSISCGNDIFRDIYNQYNEKLKKVHRIDFDDMLLLCYELLTQREDILNQWRNKFQYILIDEFQDINKVQYDIMRLLAEPRNNLFIVGDDDQSIYRFRGAKPEIMLKFPEDYPDCQKIILNQNYRSSTNIIQSSNKLIFHNEKRFEKEIIPVRPGGKDVIIREFPTVSDQNRLVAEEIIKLHREGMKLSEIAILVRTNMGSGPLLHKLMEFNIAFRMRDSIPNLFDHWITRDLLAYIKIALGNSERGLFLQIMNRPKRYISRDCLDGSTIDFEDIKDYYEDKNWMLERIDTLEYDLAMLSNMAPYAAINYIRRGIGYEDYLKEYAELRKMKGEDLSEILDELQDSARNFMTYQDWFSHMEEYRAELKRQAIENRNRKSDSLTIATMHSSKGLEFDTVFIVDANEGITPHKKAVLPPDIEEERRLFYVAMTRAKDNLYIFNSKERYNKEMIRSRFIDEIVEVKDGHKERRK